jgi:mRNA interferase HigB
MWVVTRARLREFWESRKTENETRDAENFLSTWHKIAEKAIWANWGELKQTFGTADRAGNCTIFDAGNNRYRVIGRVNFDKGKIYILKVMDHEEYDKKVETGRHRGKPKWFVDCGCGQPPPTPPPIKKYKQATKAARTVPRRKGRA